MEFVAPGAGPILDQAIAGTKLDRWAIQPAAGSAGRVAALRQLLEIPLLLGFAEHNRDLLTNQLWQKSLRKVVRSQVSVVAAAMRAEQDEEAAVQAAAEEVGLADAGTDIVDEMIRRLIGPLFERAPDEVA
jgi:hypothetical protein